MDSEKDKNTQEAQEALNGKREVRLAFDNDGNVIWEDMAPEDADFFKTLPEDSLEAITQNLAAVLSRYEEELASAVEEIADIDNNPKWQQLREVFPDIDKWIDTILEKRGAVGAALMWIEVFAPMLAHLTDLKRHIKKTKFTGTLYEFLEEPEDPKTGESLQSLFDIWAEKYANESIKAILAAAGESPNTYLNLPDSTGTDLIMSMLEYGRDLPTMTDRKNAISKSTQYKVSYADKEHNKAKVVKDSKKESFIAEIDLDKLSGKNKSVKKLFVLSLIKANQQALRNGQLTRDYITFPLQELVDRGIYKSLNSARAGFYSCFQTLATITAKGYKKKSKDSIPDKLRVLYTGYDIDNGQCIIYLNDRFNWSVLTEYFTIIPPYYFRLSNRASDLLYYIFYLARQHTREIRQQGYFTIGFRAIQERLNLPGDDCHDPKRTIKDVIENAIVEIEDANSADYNNTEFALLPVCDYEANITKYLDTGYLKVMFSGSLAERFKGVQKKIDKKITAADKKKAQQQAPTEK